MELTPIAERIQDLLSYLAPHIHLCAIVPDGPAQGRWFGDDVAEAVKWAGERNAAGENVYFSVNEVRPGLNTKPKKTDIIRARFFHVDQDDTLDPGKLRQMGADVIINSGNGLQGLWQVRDPDAAHDKVEEVNRRFAHLLDADHCYNIDRLLRVPGTVNWPTRTKVARGKVPVLATLLSSDHTPHSFAVDEALRTFPEVPKPEALGEGVVGDWAEIRLEDLQPPMDARLLTMCQTVMPQGERSEWVSKCVKALGGAGYSNETIMGLLMHPENVGLSGTILDKRNPIREAKRKLPLADKVRIDPSKAFSLPAVLPEGARATPENYEERKLLQRELNRRIGEDRDALPFTPRMSLDDMLGDLALITSANAVASMSRFTVRKLDHARNEYAASLTEIAGDNKPKVKPTLEIWRGHLKRVTVDVVTWWPGQHVLCDAPVVTSHGSRAFNTYRPVRMLRPPSNWSEWVRPFLEHVNYLVPVEAEREGFLRWVAHIVQRPHELPHTYYLMVAEQTGIGRGTLASMLTRVLRGAVAANVDLPQILESGFNGVLSGKLLATVDEIREGNSSDRWRKAERIKSLVTEEIRHVNPKYGVQSVEKNCCRWLLFSNHRDALPFDNNDRRAIVIANPSDRKPPEWFRWLHDVLDRPEFIGAVQQYLATMDLTNFNPGQLAPMNEAKQLSLAAMESDHDRKAREFAAVWPGELATTADLREFMGNDTPAPKALGYTIKRAGMITCGKPLRIGMQVCDVLIVRGAYDKQVIDAADNEWKRQQILAARSNWRIL